jgi:CheY-like chemotaxis protein
VKIQTQKGTIEVLPMITLGSVIINVKGIKELAKKDPKILYLAHATLFGRTEVLANAQKEKVKEYQMEQHTGQLDLNQVSAYALGPMIPDKDGKGIRIEGVGEVVLDVLEQSIAQWMLQMGIESQQRLGEGAQRQVLESAMLAPKSGVERNQSEALTPTIPIRTILVAEDEQSQRLWYERFAERDLTKEVKVEVVIVTNGQEALDYFKNNSERVGLIITDNEMPQKTGLALVEEVRGRGNHVPIILVTGAPATVRESLSSKVSNVKLLEQLFDWKSFFDEVNQLVLQSQPLPVAEGVAELVEMAL